MEAMLARSSADTAGFHWLIGKDRYTWSSKAVDLASIDTHLSLKHIANRPTPFFATIIWKLFHLVDVCKSAIRFKTPPSYGATDDIFLYT